MQHLSHGILVVESEPDQCHLLAASLRTAGYASTVAHTGRHALDTLRTSNFALILLNVCLSDMAGVTLLRQIQAEKMGKDTPVLMLAGRDQIAQAEACIESGAKDVLIAPITQVRLQARIATLVQKQYLLNHFSLERQKELLRFEDELEIGRQIQTSFLPEALPRVPGWDIAARLRSARAISGDFYDVFPLEEEQAVCVVIADVCGKGVGAALFMVLIRTLLRAFTSYSAKRAHELPSVITYTNEYIIQNHWQTNLFASLFIGVLNPDSGDLVYVNSGHPAPILLRADRSTELLAPTGPVVGAFPDSVFALQRTSLGPGETLFAFTDGIPDARDSDGGFFTKERLFEVLSSPCASASLLLDAVEAAVQRHIGDAAQFDDATMIAIRRHPVRQGC